MLDELQGQYDSTIIKMVLSPSHPILRVKELQRRARTPRIPDTATTETHWDGVLRMRHVVFSPPGYTSLFFTNNRGDSDCHAKHGTHLYRSFRRFVLLSFPALAQAVNGYSTACGLHKGKISGTPDPVQSTFVSRRPYDNWVMHSFMARQIDNEEEFIHGMSLVPGVNVTRYDFGRMSVEEQIAVITSTEILVAVHGAALTSMLFLPHHAHVIELWMKEGAHWRCFEHIAALSGLQYTRWVSLCPFEYIVCQTMRN